MDDNNLHSEKELFRQIANGDQDAFSIIFQSYANPLYWHALKLLRSEFWAEEVVQDTFVQLWSKRNLLQDIESPSAYLYRMVANQAFDRMRRQELEVRMQYFVASTLHASQDEATRSEKEDKIARLLKAAVDSLPEQRKLVYQLKYQQDLSYEEIAQRLSITRHTVRNQLAKALQSIRSFLIDKGNMMWLFLCLLYYFLKNFPKQ